MRDIRNPRHGCIKCSEGHCRMYFPNKRRGKDGAEIYRKNGFDDPLKKNRGGVNLFIPHFY